MPVKTYFDVFPDFFTGGKNFSRTLFSVFFTPTLFFHGHSFFIFSRAEYFVSRGETLFLSRIGGEVLCSGSVIFTILLRPANAKVTPASGSLHLQIIFA